MYIGIIDPFLRLYNPDFNSVRLIMNRTALSRKYGISIAAIPYFCKYARFSFMQDSMG